MSCPLAFTASATTACSPTPIAGSTSRPLASCCISRHPSRPLNPATAAPILTAPDPPSCAGTAARRCSSSRPSRVLSRSADRRHRRAHHDRHRLNQRNFTDGIFLIYAVANARGLVPQNVRLLALHSSLEPPISPRSWLAIDTHRSRRRDNPRHMGFCRPSNPHSAAPLLILTRTSPRFPPSRIIQPLPIKPRELEQLRARGQESDNP